jgi:hypothetical protein
MIALFGVGLAQAGCFSRQNPAVRKLVTESIEVRHKRARSLLFRFLKVQINFAPGLP